MQFGSSDNVSTVPVSVTSTSITWAWFEGKAVPTGGEQYVGYTLYYRRATESDWTSGLNVSYTTDTWQTGTVTGLDPDTEYQFNIAVYRQWTDGTRFQSPFRAYDQTTIIPLSARTVKGNTYGDKFYTVFSIYVIIMRYIVCAYSRRLTTSCSFFAPNYTRMSGG